MGRGARAPDEDLTKALAAVAAAAAGAKKPWWIIGSAAAVLHGAQTAVADIDLLMSPEDARETLLLAAEEPHKREPSKLFRSNVFGRFKAGSFPVEIMAGFHVRRGGGWRRVKLRTRTAVRLGDATLFVPDIEELAALFRLFGREKDLRRAALLDALRAR